MKNDEEYCVEKADKKLEKLTYQLFYSKRLRYAIPTDLQLEYQAGAIELLDYSICVSQKSFFGIIFHNSIYLYIGGDTYFKIRYVSAVADPPPPPHLFVKGPKTNKCVNDTAPHPCNGGCIGFELPT